MPQLDFTTYASQIFWLTVSFFILYMMVSRSLLPQVREVLQNRQNRISSDLDKAEILKREAESAKEDYSSMFEEARNKANEMLSEAESSIKKIAVERHTKLDKTLAEQMQETEIRIAEARNQAVKELHPVAVNVAQQMVERITGLSLDTDTVSKAVTQAMEERNGA